MFAKLNPSQPHFSLSLARAQKPQSTSQYCFEWIDDPKQLKQVQRFRAEQFSRQFGIQFENGLDQDLYDLDYKHAVLRDKWNNEIVAYSRLRLFQGNQLNQSYSAQEFDLSTFSSLSNIVELGRTCVHQHYRRGRALSVLWMHLLPTIVWKMQAKYLIGCVSIHLNKNLPRVYHTHQQIQQLPASRQLAVTAHSTYVPKQPQDHFPKNKRMPKLFQVYLAMQAKLSTQAFYDKQFNCLDYLVLMEVSDIMQNFVRNKMLLPKSED